MRTIPQFVAEHPFFEGFDQPMVDLLAGCGTNVHFREGEVLFQEGDEATMFYVVRKGRVAILVHRPAGGPLIIDTIDADGVLGWSWLIPPYRWTFDARATAPTSAVAFDGVCLRAKCEADPAVGYALMKRVNHVMLLRLQAARGRLLDLYGTSS